MKLCFLSALGNLFRPPQTLYICAHIQTQTHTETDRQTRGREGEREKGREERRKGGTEKDREER